MVVTAIAIVVLPMMVTAYIRIIFQIGILDDDHGTGRFPDPGLDRGAFSAVFPVNQFQDMAGGVPVLFDPFAAELRGAVGGTVIDENDLQILVCLPDDGGDAFVQIFLDLINRNYN